MGAPSFAPREGWGTDEFRRPRRRLSATQPCLAMMGDLRYTGRSPFGADEPELDGENLP
jgi:hypothetical protein